MIDSHCFLNKEFIPSNAEIKTMMKSGYIFPDDVK
jgi:hypothetical protein